MRRFLRLLRRLLLGLGVLVLLALAAVSGALWLTLPPKDQKLSIPGLDAEVDISFDDDGIPRIRAASHRDAATALGFAHARDRMFQMELMRRSASGRLSELVGAVALPIDREMRVLGLRRQALTDLNALPRDVRGLLDAYASGVNAWVAARGRLSAPEFLVFGTPEPWAPVDSLLWAKTMGLWLSRNWRVELARQALIGKLPEQHILELWPPVREAPRPDAAAARPRAYAGAAALVDAVLPRFPDPFTLPDTASNAWAVDGRHTASGAPLLAGDPHLGFGFPGIWYLARIETPDGVLAGATAPGVPAVVLGHNGHIAWTFTNTGADVQDVFVETPTADGRAYQTPDGPKPFELIEERIGVRGAPDELLTVRVTRHGPVISDLTNRAGPVLAVAMGNLAPGDTAATGLLALNRARDIDEAAIAAGQITAPVQNLLVADRTRIALFMTGRIPVRREGDGSLPVAGADGAHDWSDLVGGDALPRIVDPASGHLVNANERPAGADAEPFLGRDWYGDWRARRIRARLAASDRHTVESFAAIQTDAVSAFAEAVLPRLRRVAPSSAAGRQALGLLGGWDATMAAERPEPLIFNAWMRRFHAGVLAKAGVPESAATSAWLDFIAFVLSPAGAHWCDGDCAPMLATTLDAAVADLAASHGTDPGRWRWGDAHQAVFAHPMLRLVPLLGSLATWRIPAPGDDSTVNRGGFGRGGFDDVHGPGYRGVYDLADLDRSLFMVAPGQSGNPLSRHAGDLLRRWRDGGGVTLGARPGGISSRAILQP